MLCPDGWVGGPGLGWAGLGRAGRAVPRRWAGHAHQAATVCPPGRCSLLVLSFAGRTPSSQAPHLGPTPALRPPAPPPPPPPPPLCSSPAHPSSSTFSCCSPPLQGPSSEELHLGPTPALRPPAPPPPPPPIPCLPAAGPLQRGAAPGPHTRFASTSPPPPPPPIPCLPAAGPLQRGAAPGPPGALHVYKVAAGGWAGGAGGCCARNRPFDRLRVAGGWVAAGGWALCTGAGAARWSGRRAVVVPRLKLPLTSHAPSLFPTGRRTLSRCPWSSS